MSEFVHLHTHSHYSLLDGLSRIPEMVNKAKEYDMPALALTDHGNMHGAIEFYKACKEADIKPIIGVEAYMAKRTRFDKEHGIDNKRYHLTLLARNNTGYRNLMKLVSASYLEGYYYKPRMDKDLLRKHSDGVICLSGCPASEMAHYVRAGEMDKARELIREFQEIFGKENFFLEVMYHPEVEGNDAWVHGMKQLSDETGIPLVGTQDSHYLHEDDSDAHDTLLAVNTGSSAKQERELSLKDGDYSFINPEKAQQFFSDIPEAVTNTTKVADLVDIDIKLNDWRFPDYEIPEGSTYEEELRTAAYTGIEQRGIEQTKEVEARIDRELEVINTKGYPSYFLIVADLLRYARENGIYTNTRGSAAGSMVSYLLGITNVNPMTYNLPFERFLNPERPSLPDIDMDFADDRRDEVLEYAKQKYGEEKVAQIGTFGTMMARAAVRDVARALDYPYDTGDRIAKLIPLGSQGFPMTIDHALEIVPELKKAYDDERDTKEIIDMARKLEGGIRHVSVHAAGVVIAPTRLDDFTPVQLDPKGGRVITQYDMHAVEEAGLPKFDFLGIRNLTILADSIRIVKKLYDVDINVETIPLDDTNTYELLSRGDTTGVFQFASSGMAKYLKELQPNCIEDIIAMVALYRPGPMEFIPEYVKRKRNPNLVTYIDPRLKEILKPTYGIIVYQEQIMQIASDLAGYTLGEGDKFRKAIGKKIPEEMEKQKERFINGCIENDTKPKIAKELWDMIETFAAYGFNKGHAASYGQLAYRTAYMKANYPVPYMTAILTAESGDTEKVAHIIHECTQMDIEVLPPNINECFGNFTVVPEKETEKEKIRFGLYTIKNFGYDIADAIIDERKAGGKFSSIEEFLRRIQHKNLNKKSLESLIKCGAMDELGERGELLANMDALLEYNKTFSTESKNQQSLFGDMAEAAQPTFTLAPTEPATNNEKLAWEKELLGLYISGHPLDRIRDKLEKRDINIKKVYDDLTNGYPVVIAGIIEEVRVVLTKKNQRMAFIRLADLSGSIDAVVFPGTFDSYAELLTEETCIACRAKVSTRNDEKSLVIEKLKEV